MLEDEVERAPHVPLRQQPDEINLLTILNQDPRQRRLIAVDLFSAAAVA